MVLKCQSQSQTSLVAFSCRSSTDNLSICSAWKFADPCHLPCMIGMQSIKDINWREWSIVWWMFFKLYSILKTSVIVQVSNVVIVLWRNPYSAKSFYLKAPFTRPISLKMILNKNNWKEIVSVKFYKQLISFSSNMSWYQQYTRKTT